MSLFPRWYPIYAVFVFTHGLLAGKVWIDVISGCCAVGSAPALGAGGRTFESCHPDQFMIIRTLSSKWGTGSDLSFLLPIFCEQSTAGHPVLDAPPLISFFLLLLLPRLKFSLAFLALKELLYLREQHPRQGLYLVEWDACAIVVRFLFCHSLSSVIKLRRHISPFPSRTKNYRGLNRQSSFSGRRSYSAKNRWLSSSSLPHVRLLW